MSPVKFSVAVGKLFKERLEKLYVKAWPEMFGKLLVVEIKDGSKVGPEKEKADEGLGLLLGKILVGM